VQETAAVKEAMQEAAAEQETAAVNATVQQ